MIAEKTSESNLPQFFKIFYQNAEELEIKCSAEGLTFYQ